MNVVAPESEASSKVRVLVVEDEVLIRMFLAEELRVEGFDVIEASNADEARQILGAVPAISLVVTDIRMPGRIDGAALVRLVREELPGMKIAVLSANDPPLPEADLILRKPFDIYDLAAKLRGLLAQPER